MSKKLLLADDSITIQKVIQITFAHEDYELTITDNGDSAFTKAQEIKPDLIMADVYMPGKNGYELTSAIKQDPALQQVPVLLLAGSFEPFDEDKARSCKADAWIEKPFESQSLIDKVAELLSAAPVAFEAPAVETPAPVAASETVVDVDPDIAVEAVIEEAPVAAFDEPQEVVPESAQDVLPESAQDVLPESVSVEPEMAAASEDPFGDISFEDETPAVEPEPVSVADDWSEVVVEPEVEVEVEEPVAEEAFAAVTEEPIPEIVESEASIPAAIEETPVAETVFDTFDMGDEEIMPLGDDDILGAEDLEPIAPEQTLAAWSRDETGDADIFAEPLVEVPSDEVAPAFELPVESVSVEETPTFVEETPAFVEETPAFEEPAAEPVLADEPSVAVDEPGPAEMVAAMVDVEEKASALSEEDVEQIIERVVTKVVEKLAGTILERVAWEVVPDLAENLIRAEIRKIKDAVI